MGTSSPTRKKSRDMYEGKRIIKNVSINLENEAKLYSILSQKKFPFGPWVKNILSQYTPAELVVLQENPDTIPCALIEKAIENGVFDLDEYLAAQGKKIVVIQPEQSQVVDPFIDYDFDQTHEYL